MIYSNVNDFIYEIKMIVIVVFLMKVIFFVFIYYICICSIKYNLLVGYILYVYVIIYWDINYYINFIFLFFFDLVIIV